MENYAGMEDKDDEITEELRIAGIEIYKLSEHHRKDHPEMRTIIVGYINPWSFKRAWRYWVAKGPGIPPDIANKLHEKHGKDIRVDGHCGCPSPKEWFKGFAVGHYHIDTQEGLNALAGVIRKILREAL